MSRRQFVDVFPDVLVSVQAIDVASIPANSVGTATATVVGAAVGDVVLFTTAGSIGNVGANARVSAVDTVTFSFQNPTAGAINPASTAFTIVVLKVQPR